MWILFPQAKCWAKTGFPGNTRTSQSKQSKGLESDKQKAASEICALTLSRSLLLSLSLSPTPAPTTSISQYHLIWHETEFLRQWEIGRFILKFPVRVWNSNCIQWLLLHSSGTNWFCWQGLIFLSLLYFSACMYLNSSTLWQDLYPIVALKCHNLKHR